MAASVIVVVDQDLLKKYTSTSNQSHKCPVPECRFTTTKRENVKKHIRTHYNIRGLFPCLYIDCPYMARQFGHILSHYLVHTGENPHKCPHPTCTYSANQKGTLNRHIKKMHDDTYVEKVSRKHSIFES